MGTINLDPTMKFYWENGAFFKPINMLPDRFPVSSAIRSAVPYPKSENKAVTRMQVGYKARKA